MCKDNEHDQKADLLYEGIMLTGPGTRGAHCLLIPVGGLRNVYWQVQRTALTALMSVHAPAQTVAYSDIGLRCCPHGEHHLSHS